MIPTEQGFGGFVQRINYFDSDEDELPETHDLNTSEISEIPTKSIHDDLPEASDPFISESDFDLDDSDDLIFQRPYQKPDEIEVRYLSGSLPCVEPLLTPPSDDYYSQSPLTEHTLRRRSDSSQDLDRNEYVTLYFSNSVSDDYSE